MKDQKEIIEYENKIGTFRTMNEIVGANGSRKELIKYPYKKSHTFLFNWFLTVIKFFIVLFIIILLFVLLEKNFNINEEIFFNFIGSIMYFFELFWILILFWFFLSVVEVKIKKLNVGIKKVKINDNGIEDIFNNSDIKVLCSWEQIKGITFTKNFIVLFTNKSKINFYYPKNEEIILAIRKYKKELFTHRI